LGAAVRTAVPDLPFPVPSLLPLEPWPFPHELSFPQLLMFVMLVPDVPVSATGVAGVEDSIVCVTTATEVTTSSGARPLAVDEIVRVPGAVAQSYS
jgi:hypothetical protein